MADLQDVLECLLNAIVYHLSVRLSNGANKVKILILDSSEEAAIK